MKECGVAERERERERAEVVEWLEGVERKPNSKSPYSEERLRKKCRGTSKSLEAG